MRRPIFALGAEAARDLHPNPQEARDAALLFHALCLAIQSVNRFGIDFPAGAVAAAGQSIVGEYFASDNRLNFPEAHAEFMAVAAAKADRLNIIADTVAVTIEPCDNCQDFLAREPGIKRIVFGLSRADVANKGLVKPHKDDIFDRLRNQGIEIVQVEDEQLREMGSVLLDNVNRDPMTGAVEVDGQGLRVATITLNQSTGA